MSRIDPDAYEAWARDRCNRNHPQPGPLCDPRVKPDRDALISTRACLVLLAGLAGLVFVALWAMGGAS